MDKIQAFLVIAGRKDLAQDYFLKLAYSKEELNKDLYDYVYGTEQNESHEVEWRIKNLLTTEEQEEILSDNDWKKIDEELLKFDRDGDYFGLSTDSKTLEQREKNDISEDIYNVDQNATKAHIYSLGYKKETTQQVHKKQINKYFDIVIENLPHEDRMMMSASPASVFYLEPNSKLKDFYKSRKDDRVDEFLKHRKTLRQNIAPLKLDLRRASINEWAKIKEETGVDLSEILSPADIDKINKSFENDNKIEATYLLNCIYNRVINYKVNPIYLGTAESKYSYSEHKIQINKYFDLIGVDLDDLHHLDLVPTLRFVEFVKNGVSWPRRGRLSHIGNKILSSKQQWQNLRNKLKLEENFLTSADLDKINKILTKDNAENLADTKDIYANILIKIGMKDMGGSDQGKGFYDIDLGNSELKESNIEYRTPINKYFDLVGRNIGTHFFYCLQSTKRFEDFVKNRDGQTLQFESMAIWT